jgi:penicillin-insensitive murein endopeptidase
MAEVFAENGTVTKNFDVERNWEFFRWLTQTGMLDRIFVAKEIKQYFCEHASGLEPSEHSRVERPPEALARGGDASSSNVNVTRSNDSLRVEILRRLRFWPGHDNHFHLRLKCPSADPKCVSAKELPAGSGCEQIAEALSENEVGC